MRSLAVMAVDAVAEIEAQVRADVRRRGLDPRVHADQIATLVGEHIDSWEERSTAGDRRPLADRDAAAKGIIDSVAGLGPLQTFLEDPQIEGNRML